MDELFCDEEVQAGGLTIRLKRAVDLDALLEGVEHEDDIPFWAELWPAAVGLAAYLERRGDLAGQRVLELGCGLGLVGIGAALLGAQVTFSDMMPEAIEKARLNGAANGVSGDYQVADWRRWPELGTFDRVVGSDLFYETKWHGDLFAVLDRSLKEEGLALFADPGRAGAGYFMDLLRAKGWQVEQEKEGAIDIYLCRRK